MFEPLEPRMLMSASVDLVAWPDTVGYMDQFVEEFVAEGRIGNNKLNGTHELDLGATTAAPADTEQFKWGQTTVNGQNEGNLYTFILDYSPDVDGTLDRVTSKQGNSRELIYDGFGWAATEADTIFVRTAAFKNSSSEVITGMTLMPKGNANLGTIPINLPTGVSAEVHASGPNAAAHPVQDTLQISGVDLNAGFILAGTVRSTWTGTMPLNSNLAYQIKVGDYYGIDVDVDSDNTNGYAAPDENFDEEKIEDQALNDVGKRMLGKVVLVNEGDLDGDGVLDYLDGYNADLVDGNIDDTPPSATQGQRFTPLVLSLPKPIDLSVARLQIDYSGSAPGSTLNDGSLRLWKTDGHVVRGGDNFTEAGGSYVAPRMEDGDGDASNDYYSGAATFQALGFDGDDRSETFYIEGIRPSAQAGDQTIIVRVDLDGDGPLGYQVTDTVRLTNIRVDLDVNDNDSLNDPLDRTVNYLPGYGPTDGDPEQPEQKVSSGTTFNTAAYSGQRMQLLVEGFGNNSVVSSVNFKIATVTEIEGYAENASAIAVEGTDHNDDYSFDEAEDSIYGVGLIDGNMFSKTIWAKDYGGSASIYTTVLLDGRVISLRNFKLVNDTDNDGLADHWERAEVEKWNTQYGASESGIAFFDEASDTEQNDPDGAGNADQGRDLDPQPAAGDSLTAAQEYRGFVLDGGGYDELGNGNHDGGHARLSVAFKELLWEVDVMDGITTPVGGTSSLLESVSRSFADRNHGAGVRPYWVVDEDSIPHQVFPDISPDAYAAFHRNPDLQGEFIPIHFVDDHIGPASVRGRAGGAGRYVMIFFKKIDDWATPRGYNFAVNSRWTVAHEITHSLLNQGGSAVNGFDAGEHLIDPDEDGVHFVAGAGGTPVQPGDAPFLMYQYSTNENQNNAVRWSLNSQRWIDPTSKEGVER